MKPKKKTPSKNGKLSKEIAELALKNISDWVLVIDHKTHQWIYSNPASERTIGYKPEEIIGQNTLTTVIIPQKAKQIIKKQWPVLEEKGFLSSIEVEINHKDGRKIPISYSQGAIKNEKGQIVSRVVIARNIYGTKKLIDELKKSKNQLENRIKEIDIFRKAAVDRELRINELKEKIKKLEVKEQ